MKQLTLLFAFLCSITISAQLKSPEAFLGYEIGQQFTRHADVVNYFEHVAQFSPMVSFSTYGKTNERRPLTYAIVTSENNLSNIEAIRTNHLKNTGILSGDSTTDKAIVWLSYNVHGNEASSTEAAMATLYKLITEKQDWLENTIVIIDPCVNPDGRDRYANWYNQVKATPYNIAQDATEHHEPWPGGRPNHYLFDLNRDWAWATQIETQERLKVYNQWLPHVHVDFHEQGINDPYYFAPAAEPFHEEITDFQRDFQTKIGKNHAKYFDENGWLFFTKERFDLLYPSYGDTYPTFMGAIGMTYEQAGHGRAGLGINTDEGNVLTLKDRVAHHTTTGLSTIEVASNNAAELNAEFNAFFNNATNNASYVLNGSQDKIDAVTNLLDKHEIVYNFGNSGYVSGYNYNTQKNGSMKMTTSSLIISANQPKGKMATTLFEPQTKIADSLTYDITAWSIPYAYGLDAVVTTKSVSGNTSRQRSDISNSPMTTSAGYITKWDSMKDARFLSELLKAGINVRFSEKAFTNANTDFEKGSLIITRSDNTSLENFDTLVTTIANTQQRQLNPVTSSFANNGPDFGSPDIKRINKQKIAVLSGDYTSSLSYGELWHFFETQLHYPITSINTNNFSGIHLGDYDVLIIPDGYYGSYFDESKLDTLKEFVKNGGKIIALANALQIFSDNDSFSLKQKTQEQEDTNNELLPYNMRERQSTNDFIIGSIFKTTLDTSHPLAFGYKNTYNSLKLSADAYQFLDSGYNVGYINGTAQNISGFAGKNALKNQDNTMVFGEERLGKGSIIYMVDNPMFRSFWENGKLLLVNAIFYVNNSKVRI